MDGHVWSDGTRFFQHFAEDAFKLADVHLDAIPIARTSFGRPVAQHMAVIAKQGGLRSALITQIPMATDPADTQEAALWVIRNVCGVGLARSAPPWLASFELPTEKTLEEEIKSQRDRVVTLEQGVESLEARLSALVAYKQLLYEQDDRLELIVWAVLRELGGIVDEPKTKGRDDGVLTDPSGRRAVIEIKGRGGPLKRSDVRELEDWKQAVDEEAEERGLAPAKPILIGNLDRETPPGERIAPIPSNCMEAVSRYEVCVLPTSQLFQALVDYRLGTLDQRGFWEALNATVGLTSLPEPTAGPVATSP